ncbi:MAG: acyl-CoA dehydratase activase-related protein, partial [Spirochaetaceae bacterium]
MKTKIDSKKYFVGFDIGSDTVHTVVLDSSGILIHSPESLMHFGNPLDALKEAYSLLLVEYDIKDLVSFAFTGSAGKLIAEVTNNPFYYDTIAISQGAGVIAPQSEYIIHVGSKDPYFFERETDKGFTDKSFISDHGTGTKCGGGSGILINKQVRRFFSEAYPVKLADPESAKSDDESFKLRIDNRRKLQNQVNFIHKKASETISDSSKDLDVGGRCGVIIQSDMIHMQNSGEQIKNILKGMYTRIAKNYKSDVLSTRTIDKNKYAIVTGGIFLNSYLADLFGKELGIELHRPKNIDKIGAAGAALKAIEDGIESHFDVDNLSAIIEAQKQEIKYAPALNTALDKVIVYEEETALYKSDMGLVVFKKIDGKLPVVIGIDGGSTTTKALIADSTNLDIIAEICIDTDGKPLETAQKIFADIRDVLGDKIDIKGIAYTGSSGQFYHRLFTDFTKAVLGLSADFVKDEITCHANGVKHFNSDVDTIFECGGQDAKFTVFNEDGTVKKSKMNLSCMAGTGQSMKNMLDMLGYDFKSFKDYALAATKTPVTDEMCAIFTEAGILKLLALNFPKEEIAAAIAHGFMGGYANKFVGSEKFGKFASAQGGPFKGLGCLAALALHTDMEIHAFPHRQLFGAMGAAIVAFNELKKMKEAGLKPVLRFRGLDISDVKFEKRVENCSSLISDCCGTRDCKLQVYKMGQHEIYSGGMCPKGNTESATKRSPDYVTMYKNLMNKELDNYCITPDKISSDERPRILIPRTLHFLNQRGIFFTSLFHKLGFNVVVSPESNDEIANLGLACSHSEACFPSKLQHGHVSYLSKYLRSGVDKMFLVNFLGQGEENAPQDQSKTCPFVSGAGYSAKEAVKLKTEDSLLPLILFNDDVYKLEEDLWNDFKRAFKDSETPIKINKKVMTEAVEYALEKQDSFNRSIYTKGATIVSKLKEKGEKIFIGIGRGYTLFDDKANSKVHELFVSNGLHFVPAFFLEQPNYNFEEIVHHMYWIQGREMTRYNIMVALDPQLYGVRETNFNCGPDAMLSYHETEIFNKADKPYLTLQT